MQTKKHVIGKPQANRRARLNQMRNMLPSARAGATARLLCALALAGMSAFTSAYAAPLIPWLSADGKYGFADADRQLVIPPRYQRASIFSEGRAAVAVDGKWGYIDEAGQWIVPPRFDRATRYRGGKAVTAIIRSGSLTYRDRARRDQPFVGGGCGFLPICGSPKQYFYDFSQFNVNGAVEVSWQSMNGSPPFDRAAITDDLRRFGDDLSGYPEPIQRLVGKEIRVHSVLPLYAVGKSRDQLAFFDTSGNQVTPSTYAEAGNIASGDKHPIYYSQTAFLRWINGSTRNSHRQRPDDIWRSWDGRLRVRRFIESKREPLEGYLDEQGNEVIPAQFMEASDFSGGFAKVWRLSVGISIIDRDGNTVFPANGEFGVLEDEALEAGYALGRKDRRHLLVINLRTRQIVHSFDADAYDEVKIISSGGRVALTALKPGTKTKEDAGVCVLTINGAIAACGFEVAKDAGEGVIAVRGAGQLWGAIDYDGVVLFEPRYEYEETYRGRKATSYYFERPPFYFEGMYAEVEQAYNRLPSFYIDRHGKEFRDAPSNRDL